MDGKPDQSYYLFGAEALLKRLQALVQEIPGVRQGEDIECIHRMRVASRRLRSALPLFADCLPGKRAQEWLRDVRRITRALGSARDTDVQVDFVAGFLEAATDDRYRPGIERLLLRLRQKRAGLQAAVIAALDRFEADHVAAEMAQVLRQTIVQARLQRVESVSPLLFQEAAAAIALRLEEMLAYESCIPHPERIEELHAMRIAAKRLRYTMEVFAPAYPGELKDPLRMVRDAQEMLGAIHDCDVWVAYLPQFLEEERARTVAYFGRARAMARLVPGIHYLQEERRRTRSTTYKQFVEFWKQVREKKAWDELHVLLQAGVDESRRSDA